MGSGAGSRVRRNVPRVRPSRRTDRFEKAAAQCERPRGRSRADESREASFSRAGLEPDGGPASLVLDQLIAPALSIGYELRQSQRAPVARRERRHVAADVSEHSLLHEHVQFRAFLKLHAPSAAISVPRRSGGAMIASGASRGLVTRSPGGTALVLLCALSRPAEEPPRPAGRSGPGYPRSPRTETRLSRST
jgi:hypothetical protein